MAVVPFMGNPTARCSAISLWVCNWEQIYTPIQRLIKQVVRRERSILCNVFMYSNLKVEVLAPGSSPTPSAQLVRGSDLPIETLFRRAFNVIFQSGLDGLLSKLYQTELLETVGGIEV